MNKPLRKLITLTFMEAINSGKLISSKVAPIRRCSAEFILKKCGLALTLEAINGDWYIEEGDCND